MSEENPFPDYQPKITPDSVNDYVKNPHSIVFKILKNVGEPTLVNLGDILICFEKYKEEARSNPGKYQRGNIAIGADLEQYYPSEEEILLSELGKQIKSIVGSNIGNVLNKYKKKLGLSSQTLEYHEIIFRHVDIMGSGRFFYADKVESLTKIKI